MKDFNQLQYSADNKRNKNNKKNKPAKLGWGLLLLTIGGLAFLLVANLFGFHSSQVAVTSYQTLTQEFTAPGLIIRDEVVTFAPRRGKADIKETEGTKVRAGEHILSLRTGEEQDKLYNYKAGIVSYRIDGLENTLQPSERNQLTYEQFNKVRGKIDAIEQGQRVNVGQPLFKIIDNFKFYLAVLLPQKKLANYEAGEQIEIILTQLEDVRSFKGEVDRIIADKPENIMIIELTKFVPQIIDLRKTTVRVVKERYHGLVVPCSALTKDDSDRVGVKIRGQTKDYFKEVEVKHKVGDKAVIKGVLPGVKILVN